MHTCVGRAARARDRIDPVEWDRFAAASDASFLGSWKVIRAERGLRRQVMRRNDERFSSVVDAPMRPEAMWLGDDAFISLVEANGRAQAAFFGVRFGSAFSA